jgi:hypothetical protein
MLYPYVFALPGQYSAARKQLVQVTLSLYYNITEHAARKKKIIHSYKKN